jgi:hypothetical protein
VPKSTHTHIQLSWDNAGKIKFNIYKNWGELIKYLNTDSHHHKNYKTAVLQGVELRLALLTIMLDINKNLSLSDIYPDKHKALSTAGQIKSGQKMRTHCKVLDDESWSSPARLKRQLRVIDKRDSFFIVKYENLGHNNRPIDQIICQARNESQLKWLHPHVIYSCLSNLQEKLLGDLKHKLLWGIMDANLGVSHATVQTNTKLAGYAHIVARHLLVKPPALFIKLHVKLMTATASLLENSSDTSRNVSRSI